MLYLSLCSVCREVLLFCIFMREELRLLKDGVVSWSYISSLGVHRLINAFWFGQWKPLSDYNNYYNEWIIIFMARWTIPMSAYELD